MTGSKILDLDRLCIHTITTRPWSLETAVEKYSRAGVKGITLWREAVDGRKPARVKRLVADAGLSAVSLCRGGFFPHPDPDGRRKAVEENLRIADEAAELGTPLVVLVCGAHPGQKVEENIAQIEDGISAVLPHAAERKVRLAVEPLHPMYADTRSAICKLSTANELCERIDSPWLGIAVDVYHLWWDPDLSLEIARAARGGRLFAFHICDWKNPLEDMLNDRGLMGEGVADIRGIRGMMERNGFSGFNEVEIFSNRWWAADQDKFLAEIVNAYRLKS